MIRSPFVVPGELYRLPLQLAIPPRKHGQVGLIMFIESRDKDYCWAFPIEVAALQEVELHKAATPPEQGAFFGTKLVGRPYRDARLARNRLERGHLAVGLANHQQIRRTVAVQVPVRERRGDYAELCSR